MPEQIELPAKLLGSFKAYVQSNKATSVNRAERSFFRLHWHLVPGLTRIEISTESTLLLLWFKLRNKNALVFRDTTCHLPAVNCH